MQMFLTVKFIRKFIGISLSTVILIGIAGVSKLHAQNKYHVEYKGDNNVTGPPSSTNRVNTMELSSGPKFCYDFFYGTCSGSYDTPTRPTSLRVGTWEYEGSTAQGSQQKCHIETPYTLGVCENVVIWTNSCNVSYHAEVNVYPIVKTTSNPTAQPNTNISPNQQIVLTATAGFTSYTWQYKGADGYWYTIRSTTGNTTTVTSADIGGNYQQNIYFQAYAEGCAKSVTTTEAGPFVFVGNPVNVANYTTDAPRCSGGNDGQIVVTGLTRALASNESISITLQNAQGGDLATSTVTNTLPIVLDGATAQFRGLLASGAYRIFVESFIGGVPVNSGTQTITSVTIPVRSAVSGYGSVTSFYNGSHISCIGSTNGIISITASGGVGSFQYSSNGGATYQGTNSFGGLGAGSYTFVIKDNNGCLRTTDPVTINAPAPVTVAAAYAISDNGSGGHVSCNVNNTGGLKNDGRLRIDASGGSGGLVYSLAGITYSAAYQGNAELTSLYADVYTVSVKDANGCESADHPKVEIIQPDAVAYTTMSKTDLVCNGVPTGELEVQGASGGIGRLQYSLNGTSFQDAAGFGSLSAGSYSVTIRDTKGCTRVTSAEAIGQPLALTFSTIDIAQQSCPERVDGEINLVPATGGTGARTYSVDGLTYQPESSKITFDKLETGNYTVYVKDSKDCQATISRFVGIKPAVTGAFRVANPISCNGDTDGALELTPGGGTGPYTFAWSTTAVDKDIDNLGDGVYTVAITDSKQCVKEFQYDLKEPEILRLQPAVFDHSGYGVSCAGDEDGLIVANASGGTGPYTYSWSTGGTDEQISDLAPGNYDVYVEDSHHCKTEVLQIPITEPPVLGLTLKAFKNISCFQGTDGLLEGLATGGAGAYEYSLDGTNWVTAQPFTNLTAGSYTLRLRDGNKCMAPTLNHTLTEPAKLTLANIRQEDTSCGEANGIAEVKAGGGAGGYTYTWYDATQSTIAQTAEATALPSGDYHAVVADGNSCRTDILVIINDSDGPKIGLEGVERLTCHDSNDGSIRISISEGLAPYTVLWDTQDSDLTVTNVTGGEHWVEVHDVNGCRHKTIIDVPFPPALALDYTAVDPLCAGNADGRIGVAVSGGNPGGYTLAWGTGESSATLADLKAGAYHLTVTDTRMCKLEKEIVLTDPKVFTVDAGGDRTICVGQKLNLHAEEDNATYLWTSDKGYRDASRDVVLSTPGRYTLKVISRNGCVADDSFILATSNDLLTSDFLMAAEGPAGDTVILIDMSWPVPERINWTLPQGAKMIDSDAMYADIVFEAPGTYEVMLTTHLGECVSHFTKTILIKEAASKGGRVATSMLKRFDVYPNPNDGRFTVEIEFAEEGSGRLRLMNMTGNTAYIEESLTKGSSFAFQAAVKSIPSGVYFLILEVDGTMYTKRISIH